MSFRDWHEARERAARDAAAEEQRRRAQDEIDKRRHQRLGEAIQRDQFELAAEVSQARNSSLLLQGVLGAFEQYLMERHPDKDQHLARYHLHEFSRFDLKQYPFYRDRLASYRKRLPNLPEFDLNRSHAGCWLKLYYWHDHESATYHSSTGISIGRPGNPNSGEPSTYEDRWKIVTIQNVNSVAILLAPYPRNSISRGVLYPPFPDLWFLGGNVQERLSYDKWLIVNMKRYADTHCNKVLVSDHMSRLYRSPHRTLGFFSYRQYF